MESGPFAVGKRAAKSKVRSSMQPAFLLEIDPAIGPNSPSVGTDAELARLGIVAVPKTVFEWSGYRYTNADDAIAAARRGMKA